MISPPHARRTGSRPPPSTGLQTGGVEEVESIRGGLPRHRHRQSATCEEHPTSDHLHITTVDPVTGQPYRDSVWRAQTESRRPDCGRGHRRHHTLRPRREWFPDKEIQDTRRRIVWHDLCRGRDRRRLVTRRYLSSSLTGMSRQHPCGRILRPTSIMLPEVRPSPQPHRRSLTLWCGLATSRPGLTRVTPKPAPHPSVGRRLLPSAPRRVGVTVRDVTPDATTLPRRDREGRHCKAESPKWLKDALSTS